MELGNWSIKVQLGSTNSKGSPVLFQGSHRGFLLNNQLIHYGGSNGHAHCHPFAGHQVSQLQHDTKPRLHPHQPDNHGLAPSIHPSMPASSLSMQLLFIPNALQLNTCVSSLHSSPKKSRLSSCTPMELNQLRSRSSNGRSTLSIKQHRSSSTSAHTLVPGWVSPPRTRALAQEWRQRGTSSHGSPTK